MVSVVWYVVAPTRKVRGPVLAVGRRVFATVGEGTFAGVGVAFVPPPVEPFCPQPVSCAAIMITPAMRNNRCIRIMMILLSSRLWMSSYRDVHCLVQVPKSDAEHWKRPAVAFFLRKVKCSVTPCSCILMFLPYTTLVQLNQRIVRQPARSAKRRPSSSTTLRKVSQQYGFLTWKRSSTQRN